MIRVAAIDNDNGSAVQNPTATRTTMQRRQGRK
jgi:hypothetical protein